MKNKNQVARTKSAKITTNSRSVVWTFTNQRELNKSEFINYFERKVFRTIRKFQMLPRNSPHHSAIWGVQNCQAIRGTPSGEPKDKIFTLKKSSDLNTTILKQILETKFQVKFSTTPSTSTVNLSQASEDIFKNIIKGNFNNPQPINAPLIYLSDKEVELYAKLKNFKGEKRKQNKKIQILFNKFLSKNQDLEINILKAQNQLK